MTHIPYTARIDNFDSVMFVDRNVSFEIKNWGKELKKKINFFLNLHAGSALLSIKSDTCTVCDACWFHQPPDFYQHTCTVRCNCAWNAYNKYVLLLNY